MKFEKLHLESYGIYSDRTLSFRTDAHLHVIVGANEAGKTSALSAISDLLFGFTRERKFDFRFDAKSLRIGTTLQLQDGHVIKFRRRRGDKNTILDANDKSLGDDPLTSVLGNVDRPMFESEFGLTAERLRDGGLELLKADGRLAESLAAASAGLSALNRLRGILQQEADEIFTARKSNKPFYEVLDQHSKAVKALRDAIVTADAIAETQNDCERADALLNECEDEHKNVFRELSKLQRAQRTRRKLEALDQADATLRSYCGLPLADARSLEKWQAAVAEETELKKSIAEAQLRIDSNKRALAALQINPELLAAADEIELLRDTRGAAEKGGEDLPRRRQASEIAWQKIEQAAHHLNFSTVQEFVSKLPAKPVLARVNELVQEYRNTQLRRADADERLSKAKQRHRELSQEKQGRVHTSDPTLLAQKLNQFTSVPVDAAALRQAQADLDEAMGDLQNRTARLHPSPGFLEDLIQLPLPDVAMVETVRREWEQRAQVKERTKENLGETFSAIAEAERGIATLTQLGDVATLDDLVKARDERNAAFEALASALNADEATRSERFQVLRDASSRVDAIVDQLLENADRAARKQSLELNLAEALQLEQKLRADLVRIDNENESALERWQGSWGPTGLEPASPEDMKAWLDRADSINERYEKLASIRKTIQILSGNLADRQPPLRELASRLGLTPAKSLPPDAIFEAARDSLANLQKLWTNAREFAVRLENSKREIEEIEAEIAALDKQRKSWTPTWQKSMKDIGLGPEAGSAEALSALEILQNAIVDRQTFESEERRVVTIRDDIARFELQVNTLCIDHAPDLADEDPRKAVDALGQRLQDARRARDDAKRLAKEAKSIEQELETLTRQHTGASAVLAAARSALQLTEDYPIEATLEQLQKRHALSDQIASLHRDLAEVSDGFGIDQLRSEQAQLDFEDIGGEIERLNARADQLMKDMNAAAIRQKDVRRTFDQLGQGRNAAALAQQKQEAAAELLDVARRWLIRAGAARLAGQAIERHRQTAQDPVVLRISSLFSRATAGAFSRLIVEYGDDDQPLFVAQRAGGETVTIAGLSDGTRDQLFLALRLALLEQRGGEPLPFIGDDLLTSFDDERTGQALELLADFGVNRQAILFTHHRNVAEIARQRLGDRLDLIELGRE